VSGFDQTTPINSGRTLGGRYLLVAPIARGGMAEVWEGHDEILSRPVAVKVLQPHLATDGLFLERFRREAVTAARLAHPGVVSTFDTGIDNGTAYIVMELVAGRTLRQLLTEQGRLEPWQAVAVARQIADALASAHQAGLVHRDVKPANVLITEDELGVMRVKVTDFGIAKAGAGMGNDLTRTGTVLGTPKYVSPEQIKGEDPDSRADLYSLGVVFYEMLVGTPPFVGDTDLATAMAHLKDRVPKVSAKVRGVPAGLDRLVSDLLAKDPKRRVQSAVELRQRLDTLGPLSAPSGGREGRYSPAHASRGDTRRGDRRPAAPAPPGLRRPPPPAPPPAGLSRVEVAPARPEPGGTVAFLPGSPGSSPPEPRSSATRQLSGPSVSGVGTSGPRSGPVSHPLRSGRSTDELEELSRAGFRRGGRVVGSVVAGLVLVGAIAGGVLLATQSGTHRRGAPPVTLPPVVPHIESVTVFMDNDRAPDNPADAYKTFDGNPATYWSTEKYRSSTFGNLYSGIGLSIDLRQSGPLHTLTVTSPSSGWAAEVFVSEAPVASGQPVSAWGQPMDSHVDIVGNATFELGGRSGRYVLLWLTNLGPADKAAVAELNVS
jgi:eukaryotic-like serine/threonine-protein kinase